MFPAPIPYLDVLEVDVLVLTEVHDGSQEVEETCKSTQAMQQHHWGSHKLATTLFFNKMVDSHLTLIG